MIDFERISNALPALKGLDQSRLDRWARKVRWQLPDLDFQCVRTELHLYVYVTDDFRLTSSLYPYADPDTEDAAFLEAISELLINLEGDHA